MRKSATALWLIALIVMTLLLPFAFVAARDNAPEASTDICAAVMPVDQGQKVILWLEKNPDGGLSLHWEKHQRQTHGISTVPVSTD